MSLPPRTHALWLAYLLHRLSGLALALFLPLHFAMLARALNGAEHLQAGLRWTELPLVKLAEFGLVFCLAVHLFGGLRLLAQDLLPWSPRQKSLAAAAVALAALVSGSFALQVI